MKISMKWTNPLMDKYCIRGIFSTAIEESKLVSCRVNNTKEYKPIIFTDYDKRNKCLDMCYPGILVWSNFISCLNKNNNNGYEDLLNEVNHLGSDYAFEPCQSEEVSVQEQQDQNFTITAYRVTGRPEADSQVIAPWGYGDDFDKEKLFKHAPMIRLLAKTIEDMYSQRSNGKNKLGPLRDITINYRLQGMFKLDPHLDPAKDGSNVFVLGLLSDVVFTLTPDLDQISAYISNNLNNNSPLSIRTSSAAIATRSWTDEDIDILLKQGSLLHLAGDARYLWKHAIRIGVAVDSTNNSTANNNSNNNNNSNSVIMCDWWGSLSNLVPRNHERISIIFAFE